VGEVFFFVFGDGGGGGVVVINGKTLGFAQPTQK
jgi:hypothetical protein